MKAVKSSKSLSFHGSQIKVGDGRPMICLTDMWRAAGSPENKRPAKWAELDVTQGLVEVLALNVRPADILRTTKGRHGETWADPRLAIWYAKHLSPQFHAWANEVILERIQEINGEKRGRSLRRWRGKDPRWQQQRIEGMDVRHEFTDTLKEHGVVELGYAVCTNAVYSKLFGGTAKEEKIRRNVPAKSNLRDHLETVELASVGLAESLTASYLDQHDVQGNHPCKMVCELTATAVKQCVASIAMAPGRRITHQNHPPSQQAG